MEISWKLDSSATATSFSRMNFLYQRQQRHTDVAAQVYLFALCPHHFSNDGRGGGFAVAAGYSDDGTGTQVEKHFHFRRNGHPLLPGFGQLRNIVTHTRRTEYDVRIQMSHIIVAGAEFCADFLQSVTDIAQLILIAFVADGDLCALFGEQLRYRGIADANTAKRDALTFQRFHKPLYSGILHDT